MTTPTPAPQKLVLIVQLHLAGTTCQENEQFAVDSIQNPRPQDYRGKKRYINRLLEIHFSHWIFSNSVTGCKVKRKGASSHVMEAGQTAGSHEHCENQCLKSVGQLWKWYSIKGKIWKTQSSDTDRQISWIFLVYGNSEKKHWGRRGEWGKKKQLSVNWNSCQCCTDHFKVELFFFFLMKVEF